MRSLFAYTEEIDDIEKAVQDLEEQIKGQQKILKNSCGIVMCDYDVDTQELTERLKEAFGFPIVGCVSVGLLNKQDGYVDMCIQLMVITADDCEFYVGISEEIMDTSEIGKITELYHTLSEQKTEKEKIIFALASVWNCGKDVILSEQMVKMLDEESGGVPVFGGCAGDGFGFTKANVFYDGISSMGRVAIILICGNVKPLLRAELSATQKTISHYKVTKSEGRNVYSINNRSVKEVFDEAGLIRADGEDVTHFIATPFITSIKTEDGDVINKLSSIFFLDHKADFVNFMSDIIEGSELSACLISKDTIEISVRKAFDEIVQQISEEADYQYSTFFCISCFARYCMMVSDKNAEGRTFQNRLPEGMNLMGMYSPGEFCPAKGKKWGKLYNVYNNQTFAILAI